MHAAALAVLVALLIVAAAPAESAEAASTVSVEGGVLRVVAAAGESNEVFVDPVGGESSPSDYAVSDSAGATPGPGCRPGPFSSSGPYCSAAGVQRIVVQVGDGDDRAEYRGNSSPVPVELYGEAGRDNLKTPLSGASGTLTDGGEGDDQVSGGGLQRGGPGGDRIVGNRLLDGGEGDDTLSKTSVGGAPGRLDAGPGDDSLLAGDGYADELICGAGRDVVVQADDSDRPDASCESGKGVPRKVKILPRVTVFELPKGRSKPRRGRLAVWMKCSVPRCAVTVQIRAAGDVHQKHFVRFRPRQAPIRRLVIGNKAKLVRLRLSPAQRRGLRRQGRYDPVATRVTAKGPGGRSLLWTDGLFCTRRDPCSGR